MEELEYDYARDYHLNVQICLENIEFLEGRYTLDFAGLSLVCFTQKYITKITRNLEFLSIHIQLYILKLWYKCTIYYTVKVTDKNSE